MELIEYKGQKHSIGNIAKIEGIDYVKLLEKYHRSKNIYSSVKKLKKIVYKNEELTLCEIAKKYNISMLSLYGNYDKYGDIDRAVSASKCMFDPNYIVINNKSVYEYKNENRTIEEIASIAGIKLYSFIKNMKETNDISSAIEITKTKENKYIEYNGQLLTLRQIAILNNVTYTVLRLRYLKTNNIYEALMPCSPKYSYKGQMLSMAKIAKKENINASSLHKSFLATSNIEAAIELCKKRQSRIKGFSYNGQIIPLRIIANIENVNINTLRSTYRKTWDIYLAVKSAKRSKIKKVFYNNSKSTMTKIAKSERVDYETLKEYYFNGDDINVAIVKSMSKTKVVCNYKKANLPLKTIASLVEIDYDLLLPCYFITKDIKDAMTIAKQIDLLNATDNSIEQLFNQMKSILIMKLVDDNMGDNINVYLDRLNTSRNDIKKSVANNDKKTNKTTNAKNKVKVLKK